MGIIIQELVKKNFLKKEQAESLEAEAKEKGKSEEEILLEKRILSEEAIFQLKSYLLKIPFKRVDPAEVLPEVLHLIPEETANFYKMVPLAKKDNVLEVGMVWPENLEARQALKFLARKANLETKIFLISLSDFQTLSQSYKITPKEIAKTIEMAEKEIPAPPPSMEIERVIEQTPIIKAVENILRYGVEGEASDIHLEPMENKTRVRFRFMGKLFTVLTFPITLHSALVGRIKVLANLRLDETRVPQDGRFSREFEGRKIDFRVSTFPTSRGEKVAIRILDPKIGLKKLEDLGMSEINWKILQEGLQKPYGMILATGPTGSGKTTTLYAILQKLNKEEVNIVTLEDPVEYLIEGINQSQVRPEIGYTFAKGLRQVLRQDPDIIMVGEIRDEETAFLAVHAALTGHLVLSTLHTNNAVGAIPRLLDLGIPQFLIPPTINLIIAQRLIRTLCPHCKQKVKASREVEEMILEAIDDLPPHLKVDLKLDLKYPIYVYEAKGCQKCNFKGYVGRTGIFEILKMDETLAEVILKDPSESKILEVAKEQGMITMRQDGILKVIKGETTIEEVLQETKA